VFGVCFSFVVVIVIDGTQKKRQTHKKWKLKIFKMTFYISDNGKKIKSQKSKKSKSQKAKCKREALSLSCPP